MEVNINSNALENKSRIVRPNEVQTVKCSNCFKDLMTINVRKVSDDAFYNLVVGCPFCGDKSFALEIKGTLNAHPCNGVGMVDIFTTEDTTFYKTKKI
jgi:RNase P subunit RPR2